MNSSMQLLPVPPQPPTPPRITIIGAGESPIAVYRAQVAMRKELGDQLENLQDTRRGLSERLQDPAVTGADRGGIEARIATLDARIASVDKQIAAADAEVAKLLHSLALFPERAHFVVERLLPQGERDVVANVAWTIERSDGRASWNFRTGYNLRLDDGTWRIVCCTAYEEAEVRQRTC